MSARNEKAIVTLDEAQLSTVSGGHKSGKKWSFPKTITKTVTLDQSNVGLNFIYGDGQAVNQQSNDATITVK